ncbi:unnamed protein product, partial [Effrenium voratum]
VNTMEGKTIDVQEQFERERRERDGLLHQLSNKVQDMERDVPSMREEVNAMQSQLRNLETAWHPHIEDLQSSFLKEVEARSHAHGKLEQKIAELDAGLAKNGSLHKELHEKHSSAQEHLDKMNREHAHMTGKVAEMQECHNALRKHLEDDKAQKEKALEDLHSTFSQHGKHLSEHTSSSQERLDYLEKLMGDSADRHTRELAATRQRFQDHSAQSKGLQEQMATSLASRVEFLEKSLGDSAAKHCQELRDAHQKITDLHGQITEHSARKHATLQERMDFIEHMIGDNVQRHGEELKKTQQKVSELHGKLGAGPAGSRNNGDSQVTFANRLQYLEQALGDSAAKHQEELSHAHSKLETLHGRMSQMEAAMVDELKHHSEKHSSALDDLKTAHANLSNDKSSLDQHHSNLKERVDYLESMMGDSADHHKKVLEEQKASHTKLANDLRAREASHATMTDRMTYIEQRMGDSFDKHSQELAAAVAKVDAVHARVSEERVAREAHGASLESLRKAHNSMASDKMALEKHHSTLTERIDYLEKALGDSSEKHSRDLEALKAAHQKIASDSKGKEQSHGVVTERLGQLQREKEDLQARHMSLGERVDYLEKLLGESGEKHAQELEKVKAKHAKDLEASSAKLQGHHLGMQERLEFLEGKLGDSAEKHAKELGNVHNKVDQLHSKLLEERSQREEKVQTLHGHVRDQVAGEQKVREERHASMEERLKFLEGLLGDNADKHSKGVEEHTKNVKVLQEKHAGLSERLDYLEKALGDSADKHTQETAAQQLKLEQLHGKLSDHQTSHEAYVAKSQHLIDREKEAREGNHASLVTRLNHLEELLTGHSKDHEGHRAGQAKLGQELKARATAHSSLEERLTYLEKSLGDSADKHAEASKELQLAQAKFEQVHSRLSQVEKSGAWKI